MCDYVYTQTQTHVHTETYTQYVFKILFTAQGAFDFTIRNSEAGGLHPCWPGV